MSTSLDRRQEPRRKAHARARVEAPDALMPQSGTGRIEDMSACGLRVNSELQFHPGEALVLRVPGHVLPLHASVLWVREEPARWGGRKSWHAGCALTPESVVQARQFLAPVIRDRRPPFRARAIVMAAGVIGLLALVVYGYLKFAQLLGGSSPIPH